MSRPSTSAASSPSRLSSSLPGTLSAYETVLRPIEAVAFWMAVIMPFVYVPLLVTGVETSSEQIAVAALVAVHVVALVVGRRYQADR
ncbi:hypothetical protein [Halanaeroarchaeum sulfurireducens]|nr:hypothetical protein [Halanaeroarchaeum sulfurireducens]